MRLRYAARPDFGGTPRRCSGPFLPSLERFFKRNRRGSANSAPACGKLSFPCQGMGDDGIQVIEMRFPMQHGANAIRGRDDLRGIARAPAGELDLEVDAGHPLDALDHVAHGEAAAIAAIERR